MKQNFADFDEMFKNYPIMYSVHCTVFSVHCTVYTILVSEQECFTSLPVSYYLFEATRCLEKCLISIHTMFAAYLKVWMQKHVVATRYNYFRAWYWINATRYKYLRPCYWIKATLYN